MNGEPRAWREIFLALATSKAFLIAVFLAVGFQFLEFDLASLLEIIRAARGC